MGFEMSTFKRRLMGPAVTEAARSAAAVASGVEYSPKPGVPRGAMRERRGYAF